MSSGVDEPHNGRCYAGAVDAAEFGRSIRRFALDAHRMLRRPDSSSEELIGLQRQAWRLLGEASFPHATEVRRWLVAARRAIDGRLHPGLVEEPESLVA